ncbi:uncharacterized protein [Typha angustifolia]|uniref:uncharacterized protein isoform X2 n=1 Tax=Typha angustifolia TaxID=59011 RepID=UPI003C303649
MATAAFKSSTKRSSVGGRATDDAVSSNRAGGNRRSRSLSRYSGRLPPPESDELPGRRARFAKKGSGAAFPEISLDDLADEFFRSMEEATDVSSTVEVGSIRRRGRSVSRHHLRVVGEGQDASESNGGRKGVLDGRCRSQRSVSVARRQVISDSESHSSALTDDDDRDSHSSRHRPEQTIQAVYTQKKTGRIPGNEGTALYEAMRKEVKNVVEEIRTELEKVVVMTDPTATVAANGSLSHGSNAIQAISQIRKNYTTKLEQSEKRRQDLLAELAAEEHRGQELTMIVKELLPAPKQTAQDRPTRSRSLRSSDNVRISKNLTDEAVKYFEDFLSNAEDTDISSYDGERSETSSMVGQSKFRNPAMHASLTEETHEDLLKAAYLPVEADGIVLPWLQWETSNDFSPPSHQCKTAVLLVSKDALLPIAKEANSPAYNDTYSRSSFGSWSPEINSSSSATPVDLADSRFREVQNLLSSCSITRPRGSSFDKDEYVDLQLCEDLLFQSYCYRQRIDSVRLDYPLAAFIYTSR